MSRVILYLTSGQGITDGVTELPTYAAEAFDGVRQGAGNTSGLFMH